MTDFTYVVDTGSSYVPDLYLYRIYDGCKKRYVSFDTKTNVPSFSSYKKGRIPVVTRGVNGY